METRKGWTGHKLGIRGSPERRKGGTAVKKGEMGDWGKKGDKRRRESCKDGKNRNKRCRKREKWDKGWGRQDRL